MAPIHPIPHNLMNRLYIDQITRYMNNAKFKREKYYEDQAMAYGAIEWFIDLLKRELDKCLNVEDGVCDLTFKHEYCSRLMALLKDITGDDKYSDIYGNLWD